MTTVFASFPCEPMRPVFEKTDTMGVHSKWKVDMEMPIHKKGSSHDCDNYRPASLTSVSCNLHKWIMRAATRQYLLRNATWIRAPQIVPLSTS